VLVRSRAARCGLIPRLLVAIAGLFGVNPATIDSCRRSYPLRMLVDAVAGAALGSLTQAHEHYIESGFPS